MNANFTNSMFAGCIGQVEENKYGTPPTLLNPNLIESIVDEETLDIFSNLRMIATRKGEKKKGKEKRAGDHIRNKVFRS